MTEFEKFRSAGNSKYCQGIPLSISFKYRLKYDAVRSS